MDRLTPTIAELTQAIEQEVEKCPEAQRLRTHPGVRLADFQRADQALTEFHRSQTHTKEN